MLVLLLAFMHSIRYVHVDASPPGGNELLQVADGFEPFVTLSARWSQKVIHAQACCFTRLLNRSGFVCMVQVPSIIS